jgi:hypothetical protein
VVCLAEGRRVFVLNSTESSQKKASIRGVWVS